MFNSDIAFEDGFAYQGNYEGVSIWDVRDPSNPTLASQIVCPGSQNDVTINDGILVTSTDSRRTDDSCRSTATSTPTASTTWEGLKVFDVSDPTAPRYLASVQTDCGSHTHTVLPEDDRLLVYVHVLRRQRQQLPLREHRPAVARQDLDRRDPEGRPGRGRGHRHAGPVPRRRQPG